MCDHCQPVARTRFPEHAPAVRLNGADTDAKLRRDLGVFESSGYQQENIDFAPRQVPGGGVAPAAETPLISASPGHVLTCSSVQDNWFQARRASITHRPTQYIKLLVGVVNKSVPTRMAIIVGAVQN
jgi:hypothetical protein